MASHFVVQSMPSANAKNYYLTSILLPELLVYMVIVIITVVAASSYYFSKPQQYKDILVLKKLGDALNLARSAAIKTNTKVSICPSINLIDCHDNWTNDLIIFNNSVNLHHIKLQFAIGRLKFFGKRHDNKITFYAFGLTNNNGHFCIEKNCLYINKTGKIYLYNKSSKSA